MMVSTDSREHWDDEIEDIVGDVKLTDSQKSIATSNMYSMDFTDSSSDKNNSSGKDTYVIEQDDSDSSSDSDSYPIHKNLTVIDLKSKKNKDANVQCQVTKTISRAAATSFNGSIAQEIFTQTSKTIFELAQAEGNKESLETQTSYVSITENRTYKIETKKQIVHHYQEVLANSLEDKSSKYQPSDSDTIKSGSSGSDDRIINILDAESKDNVLSDDNHETVYENTSEYEESNKSDTSMERDSLMETKEDDENGNCSVSEVSMPQSIEDEIEDLYHKLTEKREQHAKDRGEPEKHHRTLTPLTEESVINRESLIDMTSESKNIEQSVEDSEKDVLFTNFAGGKVKMLPKDEEKEFKLPPIQNRSCPNSPQLNFLFSVHPSNKLNKAGTLPCVYEATERGGFDRWEMDTKDLASGESAFISGRSDTIRNNGSIHLPPIHIEGYVVESELSKVEPQASAPAAMDCSHALGLREPISINEKIKELKMTKTSKSRALRPESRSDSRQGSPDSSQSMASKLCDAAERGCDALCCELLRRLRSNAWYQVSDTLGEIPRALEKFWPVISENRIADLIRQVSAQVESPRTQVARAACNTLACILKHTNYTKKPDFNEAVGLLLTKTGSFSRPVRRAANVALDAVVCGAELSHVAAALCVHGVDHKSGLVRCAAARLLVVSCALAGGGRELLRARPPSAAAARRLTLRALAALLDDKNTDARRYAERLYTMLRPLANFEAYYLTDVDVERATRQMKKHDRNLRPEPALPRADSYVHNNDEIRPVIENRATFQPQDDYIGQVSQLKQQYCVEAVSLRIQYNNAFRVLMVLPRHCSASGMFAKAHVDFSLYNEAQALHISAALGPGQPQHHPERIRK